MGKFIAVIDYGLGNLRSVSKAVESTGAQVKVTNQREDIITASAIVLPGVGAFKRAMDNLATLRIVSTLAETIREGTPYLGICLGLQILFTQSEEHGSHKGLNIIKGKVKKFSAGVKIPHMGWNSVQFTVHSSQFTVFENIPDGAYFYFDHSYYVEPQDAETIVATTEYGQEFVSAVNRDNVWGVQFHPEKSSDLGLKILKNFAESI